jgi:protein transport protein SEC24
LTGTGSIFKYYNDPSNRFLEDLKYSLRSSFAFDAIMKVRTSAGIRPFEYVGNYFSRTTSDIECGSINAGNSIAVELRYDDKLPEDEFVVIQVATLYTSVSGERRVRVHNLALAVCHQVADVYRNACCDTIVNLLMRQSIGALRLGEKTVQQVKESLINRSVGILSAYRRHCAQPGSSLGQLILPEALKLLPMYITGALKCDAIDGGAEMMPDDKAYAQIKTLGAGLSATQVILYPRLLRLEYEEGSDDSLCSVQIRCSAMRINNNQGLAYVLENGFYLFLYIPTALAIPRQQQFFKNVFGVETLQQILPDAGLPELLTQESQYIHQIMAGISRDRRKALRVYVVRQGMDKLEPVFRSFLYEDKKTHMSPGTGDSGKYEAPSYVDLLCHLHKEIRAQLN